MTLVFEDLETTGLSPIHHGVWEAAYAVDDGPIQESFLTGFSRDLADPEALAIGRFEERYATPAWMAEMEFDKRFLDALRGATLVGANPSFDAGFLRQRWGYWRRTPWKYRLIDVETYAMPALHLDEPKGLAYIAKQLDLPEPDHTAAGDVAVVRQAFYRLRDIYDERLSESVEQHCTAIHPTWEVDRYPVQCTRPLAHDGSHGYAGVFWS